MNSKLAAEGIEAMETQNLWEVLLEQFDVFDGDESAYKQEIAFTLDPSFQELTADEKLLAVADSLDEAEQCGLFSGQSGSYGYDFRFLSPTGRTWLEEILDAEGRVGRV